MKGRGVVAAVLALGAGAVGADVSMNPSAFYPDTARLVRELKLPRSSVSSLSQAVISGNGEMTAARGAAEIEFFSLLSGKFVSKIEIRGGFHDGAFSHDATRYATANNDGKVRVWDIKAGKLLHELDIGGGFS